MKQKKDYIPQEAYRKYVEALPKKRMAAGIIFRNKEKKILMVEPSYKPVLDVVGGVVEENESPYEACKREIKEEIGLELNIKRLLCVDYELPNEWHTEGIIFMFYGGELNDQQITNIKVDGTEILRFEFMSLNEMVGKTTPSLFKRIQKCILAIDEDKAFYLEDQNLI